MTPNATTTLIATIREELERAQRDNFEVDVLLEGRTLFSSLMVEHYDNECVGFYDSDGSRITLCTEVINGVIVHTQQPQWFLSRNLDLRTETNNSGERTRASATSR